MPLPFLAVSSPSLWKFFFEYPLAQLFCKIKTKKYKITYKLNLKLQIYLLLLMLILFMNENKMYKILLDRLSFVEFRGKNQHSHGCWVYPTLWKILWEIQTLKLDNNYNYWECIVCNGADLCPMVAYAFWNNL